MWWPFNKNKQEKVIIDTDINVPRIILELQDDGNIVIAVSWPLPDTNEKKAILANNFATLIYLLTSGKLNSGIQHAISIFNVDDTESQKISKAVLMCWNIMAGPAPQLDKPIVPPSEAFQVRGNQP